MKLGHVSESCRANIWCVSTHLGFEHHVILRPNVIHDDVAPGSHDRLSQDMRLAEPAIEGTTGDSGALLMGRVPAGWKSNVSSGC